MKNKKFSDNFLFLSPRLTIKNSHLNKRDIRKIKLELLYKMGAANLLVSIGLLIISIMLLLSLGGTSGWKYVEVYGVPSLVAQIMSLVLTPIIIVLEVIGLLRKGKKYGSRIIAFANNLLFLVESTYMFLSIYSDAQMGFLSETPTLSASIIVLAILLVIQPVFWSIAIVYDGMVSAGLIFCALYFRHKYNVQASYYYTLIGLLFPFVSYLIIALLFYAETQKYVSDLKKESMHNTALYDELTHCKNRYALKEFLSENKKRWEDKNIKLLFVMFDIDNFKLYNDQFSHPGGDYCLSSIADGIRKEFPTPNLDFYRYGGEEFLLFFEIEENYEAAQIVEKIRHTVKNLNIEAADGAPKATVTISLGATIIDNEEPFDFDKQLAIVDKYLYQAKGLGKDICVLDGDSIGL